jgi:hypothetical protein
MPSENLRGVFAVPPLARKSDGKRTIDFDRNSLIVRHILNGRITRLLYGGNAFLYHVTLEEYEELLGWFNDLADNVWVIPSIGPGFGRAILSVAMGEVSALCMRRTSHRPSKAVTLIFFTPGQRRLSRRSIEPVSDKL